MSMNEQGQGAPAPKKQVERKRIKMLTTIVDRGMGQRVIELCTAQHNSYNLLFMGRGTANSDILDILGLGETKKDIVLSIVLEERLELMMETLRRELRLDEPGNGIAFAIPIASVGGPLTLQFISGLQDIFIDYATKRSENLGK